MVTYLYFHIQYEHTGPAFSISKTQWGVRLLKWNVFISFSLSPYSLQFHHRVHIRQLPTTTFTLFSYSKLMSGFHSFVWQHLFVYLPWRRSSTACRLMQNWRHGAEVGHLTSATANVLSEFVLHCPLPRMVYPSLGRTESSKIRKLGSPGAPADSKRTRLFFPWCVEEFFFTRGWYARLHSNNLPWGFGGYIVSCSEHWGSPRQRLTFPQGLVPMFNCLQSRGILSNFVGVFSTPWRGSSATSLFVLLPIVRHLSNHPRFPPCWALSLVRLSNMAECDWLIETSFDTF